MRTQIKAQARGKQITHSIEGFPVNFTARWLHAVSRDGFDAYVPRRFSGQVWLVYKVDEQPTLGLYVVDEKPSYWIRNLVNLESVYLDQEPDRQVEVPELEYKQYQKGRFFLLALPLSQLADLLGDKLWWVEGGDGLERVIPAEELDQWLLTRDKRLINLQKRAGCWIKNVAKVWGDRGYIEL